MPGALRILAISGSARADSTNTALLQALAAAAPVHMHVALFQGLPSLPIFCPNLEGIHTPAAVQTFCTQIAAADGVILSSPEYVRAIPGGLKNAIDWLVSREEIIHKPIALAHASHRGDDMLGSLRLVLGTVSERFAQDVFIRIPLMSMSAQERDSLLHSSDTQRQLESFLHQFGQFIQR